MPCMNCCTQCPQPCSRPPPTHTSTRDSRTPTGKSGTVSSGVTAPFSWVLVHGVLLCPPRVYFPGLCKFWQSYGRVNGALLQEGLCHSQVCCTQSPSLRQTTAERYLHRRLSNTVLSQSLWGPCVLVSTGFFSALWASLVGMGYDSKHDFTPPTVLLGFLWSWTWGISTLLVQQRAAAAPDLRRGVSPLHRWLIQCHAAIAHHSSNAYYLGEKLWPT